MKQSPQQKTTLLKRIRSHLPLYVMALSGVLYLFVNNYMPLPGLQLAFKKFKYADGIWGSAFNGLKNFRFLFRSSDAGIIIRNTLCYREFAEKWLPIHARKERFSPNSYDSYRSNLERHILPYFGDRVMNSITAEDIDDFLDALSASLKR